MKIRIAYILSLFFAMAVSSCEKVDMDEYLKPELDKILEEINKTGEDGEVQTEGAVDLGLSVKWAACNLDKNGFANDCTNLGYVFPWTEKQLNYYPEEIGGTALDPATVILGDSWQTPSVAQWEELLKECRIHYTAYKDAVGYIITGPSGKAIFIPDYIPEYTNENNYEYPDITKKGAYWSSSSNGTTDINHTVLYAFVLSGNYGYRESIYDSNVDEFLFFNRPVERK